MLKFFRAIRKRLILENGTRRYLLYAIGEILLVVIGILIALQVNTWNEHRINAGKEKQILDDLNNEFVKNKVKLDAVVRYHQTILGTTKEIMRLIGEPEDTVLKHNPDSLIYLALDYTDYKPSQSVISELISSGKLNLVSSDSLRMLIFDWGSAIEEKEEGYETLDEMTQNLTLSYLAKHGSMKDIDVFGLLKEEGRSKFEPQNHLLFQELEFENHMDNQAWGITNYLLKLERLNTIMDGIIGHTNVKTRTKKISS